MMFKCKENCGECCGIVPIKKEVWEKNLAKAQKHIKEVIEIRGDVYAITDDIKCVFLSKRNKCVIYEDRPQICRNYGIGYDNALSCPYIKPNGNPRSPAMIKRIQRMINRDVDAKIKQIEKIKNSDLFNNI